MVATPAAHVRPAAAPGSCRRTFTVPMAVRGIHAAYRGTRDVSTLDRLHLTRFIRCQRNQGARGYLHGVWARSEARWHLRRNPPLPPLTPALASWYDDAGTTGCGFHTTYGIATDIVPCGAHVTIYGPGGVVDAVRDDSPGPAVAGGGRTFDFNPEVKAAAGCGDLCEVRYSIP